MNVHTSVEISAEAYLRRQKRAVTLADYAARAEERKKSLAEIRGTDAKALQTVEVVDAGKGFIRVKIDTAMDLTVKEYQNPTAFRAELTARANKLAEPPPKKEYE